MLELGVPSDVWILRLAGGKPAADGVLRFLFLNRNDMVYDLDLNRMWSAAVRLLADRDGLDSIGEAS